MEPMATAITLVIPVILVTLVTLALVKWSRDLTLPILALMKVDSQTIQFMTPMLERTRLGTLMTMKMCLLRQLSLVM